MSNEPQPSSAAGGAKKPEPRKLILFGIIVVCLIALVYLSLNASDVETPPPLPTGMGGPGVHPGGQGDEKPPDFTLAAIDGRSFTLSALRGKVVMINFWSSNCGPCIMEMPAMQKLYEAMKGKPFEILAITSDPKPLAESSIRQLGVTFPILIDPDSAVGFAYQAYATPTTYILDPAGGLAFGSPGAFNWSHPTVIDFINGLLAQPAPPGGP